jgi:hypothetical protein
MADNRTYQDRREYLLRAVKERQRHVRQEAVAYKGGRCAV